MKKSPFDIIMDVDGTVADCGHRLGWISCQPKNWTAFLDDDAILQDAPIQPVIDIIDTVLTFKFDQEGGARLICVTARNDSHKEATKKWLNKHGLYPDAMYMRKDGDFRKDTEVKLDILNQIRDDGYDPKIVFDDRLSVCKMWSEQGLFVFCVNQKLKEY